MIKEFKNQYFFLSNFYEYPIYYNKLVFCNAEAAFQAQKVCQKASCNTHQTGLFSLSSY